MFVLLGISTIHLYHHVSLVSMTVFHVILTMDLAQSAMQRQITASSTAQDALLCQVSLRLVSNWLELALQIAQFATQQQIVRSASLGSI